MTVSTSERDEFTTAPRAFTSSFTLPSAAECDVLLKQYGSLTAVSPRARAPTDSGSVDRDSYRPTVHHAGENTEVRGPIIKVIQLFAEAYIAVVKVCLEGHGQAMATTKD